MSTLLYIWVKDGKGNDHWLLQGSVGDPNPQDPHVFGPLGSGSLVKGAGADPDPAPDPSLFWNNACNIGFWHKIFEKNLIFKTEDNVAVVKL